MNTASTDEEFIRQRNRGRRTLILLAFVFFGPLAAAFALYYGNIWKPTGMAVNGLLIQPPRPLPTDSLISGAEAPRFMDLWTLVIVAPGDCDDTCQKALVESRQVRRALGKERDRVQRVWLVSQGVANADFVAEQHPNLATVPASEPRLAPVLAIIGEVAAGEVLVVDPLGNLMMRFPPGTTMRAMDTDLKKLLKTSRIG
jgi:hypothetical protein